MSTKNSSRFVPLLIAISVVAGILIGTFYAKHYGGNRLGIINGSSNKLNALLRIIDDQYVDTVNMTDLVEKAMPQILAELDPHSTYIPARMLEEVNSELEGSFSGIGVEFTIQEDTIHVNRVVPGGPAEKVGMMGGDRIVTVDDSLFVGKGLTNEKAISHLKGPKGTEVRLGIVRRGQTARLDFTVKRDKIPVSTVDAAYMATPRIGLIRLASFGSTSHKEVTDAINKLRGQGMQDLILDLQQNGGGYLDAATDIAGEFLPKGDLIVYTKGLRTPYSEYRAQGAGSFREGRVIVLVDEYSASAAEIVTGAIQDQDRGLVVGRRTFGKGLVQKPFMLPDGSMIRLTVARYYTPSGRCIQKPYTKGDKQGYDMDVIERYNHGELTNADSIHFPDSLKYKTLRKGRTVYGGGGIMPDYFIPLDTSRYTRFHRELTAKGAIVNADLKFIEKYRKKIQKEYPDFNKFRTAFEVPQELVDLILAEGEKAGVKPKDDEELQATLPELKLQMKALIARDIWDMSEYFAVIYEENPCVRKAIELLEGQP